MSQSQKDSDVPLGQDPTEDSHGTPPNPDLVDDEDMNSAEEEETETEGVEPEHGEPSDDELADREERPCSVGAEQAAQRDFGELCAEDLKEKKVTFGDYINWQKRGGGYISRSLHWTVTWYVHFFFEFA